MTMSKNKFSISLLVLFFIAQGFAFFYQIPKGTEFFKFSMYHEITYYQFEVYVDKKKLSDDEFLKRYKFNRKGNWRAIEHLLNGIKQYERFHDGGGKVRVVCNYTEDLDQLTWKWKNY